MGPEPARASGQNLIGRLAGRVAHDLNNAIAVLSGHLYLLRAAAEPPGEAVDAMEKATEQIERFSRSLAQLAAIGEGEPDAFEWNAVAREAAKDPLHWSGPVEVDLAPDLPPVRGRSADIRRALDCLLANAREASTSGTPIRIVTRPLPAGGALLAVEDSGAGIPPEISERVFTPFFSTRGERGRGIGLTIVGAVAAAHGGDCGFEARQGGGTRFTIRIPG